jgi:hypothetical protein
MSTENKEFELRECPFCGKSSALLRQPYFAPLWMIECANCHCISPLFETQEKTVEFWNRRNGSNE